MNRQMLIKYCLSLPDVYEDYPFDDNAAAEDSWAAIRHRKSRRCFAFIYRRFNKLWINLKCDPERADFFRQVYVGVTPGYHMNKEHWNTIEIHSDVPNEELFLMIEHSYSLTAPKKPAFK